MKRVLSAAVFIPIFVLVVAWGSAGAFFVLVAGAIGLGLWEFYDLIESWGTPVARGAGIVGGLSLATGLYLGRPGLVLAAVALVVLVPLCQFLVSRGANGKALVGSALTCFGAIYVAGLLGYVVLLRALPYGQRAVFLLVLMVWLHDTLAYYGGRVWGRRPLAPALSGQRGGDRRGVEPRHGPLFGSAGPRLGRRGARGARSLVPIPREPRGERQGACGLGAHLLRGDLRGRAAWLRRAASRPPVRPAGRILAGADGVAP